MKGFLLKYNSQLRIFEIIILLALVINNFYQFKITSNGMKMIVGITFSILLIVRVFDLYKKIRIRKIQ